MFSSAHVILTLLVVLNKANFGLVNGFRQELKFYSAEDNVEDIPRFNFKSGVPSPSFFSLDGMTKVCTTGMWALYLSENYEDRLALHGSSHLDTLQCYQFDSSDSFSVSSFRHLGPGETSISSLTLYPFTGFEGQEYFLLANVDEITAEFQIDALDSISSIVTTGIVNWTLFEEKDFQGKSICYEAPRTKIFNTTEDIYLILKLSTIGSIISTCDQVKINSYINERKPNSDFIKGQYIM